MLRFSRSPSLALAVSIALASTSGCSLLTMRSPPPVDVRSPQRPVCQENGGFPAAVDVAVALPLLYGGLLVWGSGEELDDRGAQEGGLTALGIGAVFGASLLYGFNKADECRAAIRKWQAAQPAPTPSYPPPWYPPPAPGSAQPVPPAAPYPTNPYAYPYGAPPPLPRPALTPPPVAPPAPPQPRRGFDMPGIFLGPRAAVIVPLATAAPSERALPGIGATIGADTGSFTLELAADYANEKGQGHRTVTVGALLPVWLSQSARQGLFAGAHAGYAWRVTGRGASGFTVVPTVALRLAVANFFALRLQASYFWDLFEEAEGPDRLVPTARDEQNAHGVSLGAGVEFP